MMLPEAKGLWKHHPNKQWFTYELGRSAEIQLSYFPWNPDTVFPPIFSGKKQSGGDKQTYGIFLQKVGS